MASSEAPDDVDALIAEVAEQNSLELETLLPTVAARAKEKKIHELETLAQPSQTKSQAASSKVSQAI